MHKLVKYIVPTLLCLGLMLNVPAHAASAEDKMGRIKAALIYKLSRFIIWPDSAFEQSNSPIEVCIVGDDAFDVTGKLIKGTQNRKSQGKLLNIMRLSSADNISSHQCHIVYFTGGSELKNVPHDGETMIIVENKEALKNTGAIGLIIENNKMGVYVNLGNLKETLVKIDPVVLSFAKRL